MKTIDELINDTNVIHRRVGVLKSDLIQLRDSLVAPLTQRVEVPPPVQIPLPLPLPAPAPAPEHVDIGSIVLSHDLNCVKGGVGVVIDRANTLPLAEGGSTSGNYWGWNAAGSGITCKAQKVTTDDIRLYPTLERNVPGPFCVHLGFMVDLKPVTNQSWASILTVCPNKDWGNLFTIGINKGKLYIYHTDTDGTGPAVTNGSNHTLDCFVKWPKVVVYFNGDLVFQKNHNRANDKFDYEVGHAGLYCSVDTPLPYTVMNWDYWVAHVGTWPSTFPSKIEK